MRSGVLFSGGKDSCLAMHRAAETNEINCLITVVSANPESYMFHTPNISLAPLQAEALGLPLVSEESEGKKEEELKDLERAVERAVEEHGIEGVVTGALASTYQATRVQRICDSLDLWCFNPLWLADPLDVLREVLEAGFEVMITGVFAYPLTEDLLGSIIDENVVRRLAEAEQRYAVNPSGEGGEIETTVLYGPGFRSRIMATDTEKSFRNYAGTLRIKDARLEVIF